METTRRLPRQKRRPARREPDEAQDTPRVAIADVTAEGEAADLTRGLKMHDAIEARLDALTTQLIALQATLVALVPVISIVDADDVRAAMRGACRDAAATLEAARFDDARIADVVREIETLSGEIIDRARRPAVGYVVKAMPC
jgi:hypothetical protein